MADPELPKIHTASPEEMTRAWQRGERFFTSSEGWSFVRYAGKHYAYPPDWTADTRTLVDEVLAPNGTEVQK